MLKNVAWVVGGLLVLTVVASVVVIIQKNNGLSMLNPIGRRVEETTKPSSLEMVGFLPTWMVGKTKMYEEELSHLIFLGIEVNENGNLVWDIQSRKINSDEFINLKNSIKKNKGKVILGIKLFDDQRLEKFIGNELSRKNLIREVEMVVKGDEFDGVNIDFEYMSNPVRILDEDFGIFFEEIKKANWGEVSVDVFANTIIKGDPDRLKKMMGRVDRTIVMAYDFHRPGSDFAGAVAPMEAATGERSVGEIFRKISDANLERKKIIMAYPLYGYEWQTATNEYGSVTETGGYGRTVFYKEGVGFTGTVMDIMSQSPWVAWVEEEKRSSVVTRKVGKRSVKETVYSTVGQWHQAYFENEESLKIKMEASKQAKVGGVGFWALGYEGMDSNLLVDLEKILNN